jgi:hypothetical protein
MFLSMSLDIVWLILYKNDSVFDELAPKSNLECAYENQIFELCRKSLYVI